ncbi:matrix metalloproteinase-2 [Leptopilina heterotoma]|uniref:matrix metalloproteinase-2 n=1 Tax=Leptopilina heterotoma TaxID=63436 RepID=UPI001CA8B001|nr:matrix metalloproteinase-2 [Leptopilina heterotoma]
MILHVLISMLTLVFGAHHSIYVDDRTQNYLMKFGYLPQSDLETGNLRTDEQLRDAIKDFQGFAGIPVTGVIDEETKKKMASKRCGLPDKPDPRYAHMRRHKRFTVHGQKWNSPNLTWSLRTEQPSGLETGEVRLELSRALAIWSANSKLTFQEVNSDQADILVYFHRGYHGDGYPFDGRGKILAHAFFPGGDRGGDAHFDEEEIWLLNGDDSDEEGTSLFAVAAHEFGHSLGLSHSSVRGALMYPWYQGITTNFELPEDDRNGIQQMYGAPENKLWAYIPVFPRPRRPTTTTTTTTPRITTTTYRPWKTRPTWSHYPNYYPHEERPRRPLDRYPDYRNEGTDYRPRDRYPIKPDYRTERPDYRPPTPRKSHVHHHPRPTTTTTSTTTTTTTTTMRTTTTATSTHRPRHHWTPRVTDDIPHKCDTSYDAISVIRREVFIFKGRYLWRIGDQGLYEGFPAEISRLFNVPKDTDHVDAVYERHDKKIVFFIGRLYYVFSANILEPGYPKPLTSLGLPASLKKIDGAMVWGHNKRTYFFSGTMYWRFDESVNHVELDYPRDMSMFAGVGNDIDAVFQWKNGKTYFFKGKYFWEFDDMRMRVAHEKPKLSSVFWMNCPSDGDSNDIDETPRRRTNLKISSSSVSSTSSLSYLLLTFTTILFIRNLMIRNIL